MSSLGSRTALSDDSRARQSRPTVGQQLRGNVESRAMSGSSLERTERSRSGPGMARKNHPHIPLTPQQCSSSIIMDRYLAITVDSELIKNLSTISDFQLPFLVTTSTHVFHRKTWWRHSFGFLESWTSVFVIRIFHNIYLPSDTNFMILTHLHFLQVQWEQALGPAINGLQINVVHAFQRFKLWR